MPADLGLGASYTAVFNEDNKVMFGLDLHKLLVPSPPVLSDPSNPTTQDSINTVNYHNKGFVSGWTSSFSGPNQLKSIQASIGAEYSYQDQFFFRAGYYYHDA